MHELASFEEAPCPPELLGINHYITSSRYLDQNVEAYPPDQRGGNGRVAYADIEAVRARPEGFCEPQRLLHAALERYGIPLAITEAHLGCTREEQMRWLGEMWSAAHAARRAGVPVAAVTAWSLFARMIGTHCSRAAKATTSPARGMCARPSRVRPLLPACSEPWLRDRPSRNP